MPDFLAYHRALGKRFASEEDGLRLLDRYLLRQPVTTPETITPALLETFLTDRPRQSRGFNTLWSTLRRFCDWLVLHEVLARSPLTMQPRCCPPPRPPFLFDQPQMQRLLAAAAHLREGPHGYDRGPTYQLALAMMYGLGLRVGEVARLCRQDGDLVRQLLVIRDTKFAKTRLVPFGPRLGTRFASYRDGLRLFLQFVSPDTKRAISRLALTDLRAERVRRFLNTLEAERANHVRTCNQRLSALRVFFNYLGTQVPEMLVEAERVGATPMKRVPPPETYFLERDEITARFASLPTPGRWTLRDRTLLLFLYNTGARVQEVADVRMAHLELTPQARVHLHGKGNKWRVCPLWQETVSLLQQLLQPSLPKNHPDRPVFTSQNGQALTRYGIYKIVRRHTAHLEKCGAAPRPYHISPHVFRHSTAVHLLESGAEVNVIRGWLGHVSLETTHRYAEITLQMKAEALQMCEVSLETSEACPGKAMWRDDPSLLKWLQSL
jgi:site-specific recombinase XerD